MPGVGYFMFYGEFDDWVWRFVEAEGSVFVVTVPSFADPDSQIIGVVVYHFCGIYVTSPALGSAGPLFKKICYGLALPGLLCGAILNTHIPAKLSKSPISSVSLFKSPLD